MAKVYDMHQHQYVIINIPRDPVKLEQNSWYYEGWHGTFPILLHLEHRVWVSASYHHVGEPDVVQVGDGLNGGFDREGCCIISVPADWCAYYTNEEADMIAEAQYVDDQLLGFAKG